jgi:pyrroline-5-carboxylate reductase
MRINQYKIGFIGCGNMAQAIIKGLIKAKALSSKSILASDLDLKRLSRNAKALGIKKCKSNAQLVLDADIIIIAVKPQDIKAVLDEISQQASSKKIVISIAAGITRKFIKKYLKNGHIIRVMPNIGSLRNESATAICFSETESKGIKEKASAIFESIGLVHEVKEKDMDIVTALSGSGPAYLAFIYKVLSESASQAGLNKQTASSLISQTALAAASFLLENQMSAEELIKKVTSKGGTTEAAMKVFKREKIDKILSKGFKAALKRAKELSK